MPNEHSVINWFHVRKVASLGCEMPLVLVTERDQLPEFSANEMQKHYEAAAEDLVCHAVISQN
jgi:hypothetical protein